MKYLVFDLDCTLGLFSQLDIFLDMIHLRDALQDLDIMDETSDELLNLLDETYHTFVENIALAEKDQKIGLFSPWVFPLFTQIVELQRRGTMAKCMIQSNNSSMQILEFARDVIQESVDQDVFCELVDWNHPIRDKERVKNQPGSATKTFETIVKVLSGENCKQPAHDITPDKVQFFDDLEHEDLIQTLPWENYIHVNEYVGPVYYNRLKIELVLAMETTGLLHNKEQLELIQILYRTPITNSKDVLTILDKQVVEIDKEVGKRNNRPAPARKHNSRKNLSVKQRKTLRNKSRDGAQSARKAYK